MSETVLYVDDDEANLTVFEAACAGEFTVATATSGQQALEYLQQHEVAVLLTDQRMPSMSGAQLAEQVAIHYPDTVRYLITAYSDLGAAIEAINQGQIRRYLRKPWDLDELKVALKEALDVHQMRKKVGELERRLVEVERVYSLGVVAASVAHELRNPMSVICGNLELALVSLDEFLEQAKANAGPLKEAADRVVECMEGAQDGSTRMLEIMRGIELSTRRQADTSSTDLSQVVRLTAKMLAGHAHKKSRLELNVSDVPIVRGSKTKLSQVVLNLIVNAFEAMPEERSQKDNLVTVSLSADDAKAELRIKDNGPGIDEEGLDRIFDPFFTTKMNGGTGLGLAISRQIIEDAGGTMDVESQVGSGACFVVKLPFIKESLAKAS